MKRLPAFDSFRGLAILLIVAAHSYGQWTIDTFSERVLANLITGGTELFVFVSGFFFQRAHAGDFRYSRFIVRKAQTILCPYIVLTLSAIAARLILHIPLPDNVSLGIPGASEQALWAWQDYFRVSAIYLWTGKIIAAFWFIPFIFGIYLLSPIFIVVSRMPAAARASVLVFMMAAAAILQRPLDDLSVPHAILYFSHAYLLGMEYSIDSERINEFLRDKLWHLSALVIGFAALQAGTHQEIGSIRNTLNLTWNGIDILCFQKVSLCLFLITLFNRFEHRTFYGLHTVAAASFPIFFIHSFVLSALFHSWYKHLNQALPGFLVFLVTVPVAVLGSLAIAYVIRRFLKRRSRYIIGW